MVNSQENEGVKLEVLRRVYDDQHHRTLFTSFVFIFVCAFICVTFFALSVFFPPSTSADSVPENQKPYDVPCLDPDTQPLAHDGISLRILNGSGMAGLATAVGDALILRGFSIIDVDNAPSVVNDNQIWFGENAAAAAFTLAQHFDGATMIEDDRTDGMIDVVIGRGFTNLKESELADAATSSGSLEAPSYCIHKTSVRKQVALDHDVKKVPAYTTEEKADDQDIPTTDGD
jgi:hypothetical protein